MKATKLTFEEISKDQILTGDDIAKDMISKVKSNEALGLAAVIITLIVTYFAKAGFIGSVIILGIGLCIFGAFDKVKESWEAKLENYFLTKKASNPSFQYMEEEIKSENE